MGHDDILTIKDFVLYPFEYRLNDSGVGVRVLKDKRPVIEAIERLESLMEYLR